MPETPRQMPAPRPAVKTEMMGPFRVSPADKEEIQQRAKERNLDMTAYITDAALGRLDENFQGADEAWRQSVARRLERLETLAYGSD